MPSTHRRLNPDIFAAARPQPTTKVIMLAERLLHHVGFHGSGFSTAQAHERARGLLGRLYRRFCATRGHDLILQFEPGRLSLRCVDCGWESAGWMIDRPRSCTERIDQSGWTFSTHVGPPRAPLGGAGRSRRPRPCCEASGAHP